MFENERYQELNFENKQATKLTEKEEEKQATKLTEKEEEKQATNLTEKEEKKQKPEGCIVKYYKEKEELLAERKKYKKTKSKIPTIDMLSEDQTDLYDYLRGFRREIAFKENVAPFIVFNNTSLIDMCHKLPRTLAEFRNVYGVGEYKQKKYGELFIRKIKEYYGDEY